MDLLTKKLKAILGNKGFVENEDCLPWQKDWLNKYGERPLGVVFPKSTEEVSEVMRLCFEAGVSVTPQGGNTGLVGASVLESAGGIIMSLSRMNRIASLDILNRSISLEAGVILENLHQHLDGTGLIFPMHLGSGGSAQIGGLIATNAGGCHAFRYGMMQDLVLGLEVVLADGTIWNGMRSVQKDNAGYQLRKLFCGSEGTLGIVTKTVLKLSSSPKQRLTGLFAIKDDLGLINIANKLSSDSEEFVSAIEFFSDVGLGIALKNIPDLKFPLSSRSPFYVLVELTSGSKQVPLDLILNSIMEWGMEKNIIIDGTIALSEAQRLSIWRLREEQPEGQKRLGLQLKHDLSVPPGELAAFLKSANDICISILKGVIINPYGHLGDGNIHYNLSPPENQKNFSGLDAEFSIQLGNLTTLMGGSFAAEHGIGRTKVALADTLRDPIERNLMKMIKKSIDKNNQLNPGVLVSK